METLYLLIPLSVVLVFLIGIAFWWSLRNGQFEDLEGPAYRLLMDDDRVRPEIASQETEPGKVPQTDDSTTARRSTKARDT